MAQNGVSGSVNIFAGRATGSAGELRLQGGASERLNGGSVSIAGGDTFEIFRLQDASMIDLKQYVRVLCSTGDRNVQGL